MANENFSIRYANPKSLKPSAELFIRIKKGVNINNDLIVRKHQLTKASFYNAIKSCFYQSKYERNFWGYQGSVVLQVTGTSTRGEKLTKFFEL
jgi:hypothetical protein